MLERLTIKNLALIKDAEIEFCDKLNIFSGETGAGKSIVVDALMLLMGNKYDKTMLSYGQEYGLVEGVFSSVENEYSEDGLIIITRKFNSNGKNDIKVNGRTVTLTMLKELAGSLIDICGQNEYQFLSKKSEHMLIIDKYAGDVCASILTEISSKYTEYKGIKNKLASIGDVSERLRKIDTLKYNIDEINSANIIQGEEQELEDIKKKSSYGEKIKLALDRVTHIFDDENGVTSSVSLAMKSLSQICHISEQYQAIYDRFDACSIELDDISATISDELSNCDFDENLLEKTENRLQQIRNLKRKYGESTDLIKYVSSLEDELDILINCDEYYDKLSAQKNDLINELYELSVNLSSKRREYAKKFEQDILGELSGLGMEKARFEVVFAELPNVSDCEKHLSKNGLDNLEFYLSPNIGQPMLPLVKIISGGEMSRFMLAIKVVSSKVNGGQTMIFDEIDTGISGIVGQEVAKKLAVISKTCQIMCVTHLAQIASMADTHYFISKSDDNITTKTNISKLTRLKMIEELARLGGGAGITQMASQNAEEIKNWSDDFKLNI